MILRMFCYIIHITCFNIEITSFAVFVSLDNLLVTPEILHIERCVQKSFSLFVYCAFLRVTVSGVVSIK